MDKKQTKELLCIKDLEISFWEGTHRKKVVKKISLTISEGEKVGIVGESGSGKSMTSLAAMQLLPEDAKITNGSISFEGDNMLLYNEGDLQKIRGKELAMVFQEPMTSLNPVMTIGRQLEEVFLLHEPLTKEERRNRVLSMLMEVGLKNGEELWIRYPHQLSGGMRQRVMIAMAMLLRPKLLIADEPTTALDVTVQAQILDLLNQLNEEYHTSILLISHDLGVIKKCCSRAVVMNEGCIVEEGSVEELFASPKEVYTKKLLAAVPGRNQELQFLESGMVKAASEELILEADGVDIFYQNKHGIFSKGNKKHIVKAADFYIRKGEIVGIVGESGSGKSTLSKAVTGLIPYENGNIELGEDRPAMVFQDPYSSLNPSKKVGWLIEEPLRNQRKLSREERKKRVDEMLVQVGLTAEFKERYVRQLSGGQRQRVGIACALITNTKLIVLDEPVSALDVTIQAQILSLLLKLRETYDLSYLFISHDLNVVYQICDRIYVMENGRLIENGTKDEIFHNPKNRLYKEAASIDFVGRVADDTTTGERKGRFKMIIDFHTHVFPESIAERTLEKLGGMINTKPYTCGTLKGLKASMKESGIDYSVILPVVTKPEQFESVNKYAASITGKDGILSFGGIHPKSEQMEEKIDYICELGLKGIKLHPDFQNTYIDEPFYVKLISYALQKNLIVSIHAGVDLGLPNPVHCPPKRTLRMLEEVEKNADTSKIVLAHMGGFRMWDDVRRLLIHKNVYFDISFCRNYMTQEDYAGIIEQHGADKILFGTDSPWDGQKETIDFIANLPIKFEEKEKILGKNAEKIIF